MRNFLFISCILMLCTLLFISCTRVEVAQQPTQGELQQIKLAKLDSIPMEYGSLIGVTPNKEYPRWAQLWFQDNNGTIRIVSVGFLTS